MSVKEFELREEKFGWKNEYANGFAYITPRDHGILMKIEIAPRKIENSLEITSVTKAAKDELDKLFFRAFVDSVEYCDYAKSEVRRRAQIEIEKFFEGRRGKTHLKSSKIAVSPRAKKIIGACLVTKYKYGFRNEILFVDPKYQRKGIGTILVSEVINDLNRNGEKTFWSEHHICNELSRRWHEKFGFVEVTDIMTAKFRRNYFRSEVWRNEQLGNREKIAELKLLQKAAEKVVEELEKIREKDFEAAHLSWKYDF